MRLHDLGEGDTLVSGIVHMPDALHHPELRLFTVYENPIPDLWPFAKDIPPKSPVLVCSVALHGCHLDISKEEYISPSRDVHLYQILPVANKGLGMISTRRIRRGQRILSEAPLIRQSRFAEDKVTMSQYHKLSDDQKQQVLALHNVRPHWGPVMGVLWTNAIPLRGTEHDVGLFATASRINHACLPNTVPSWNNNLGRLAIHAARDIEEGEEITSMYMDKLTCYDERQRYVRELLGFNCTCRLCLLPVEERRHTDSHIRSINSTKERLSSVVNSGTSYTGDLQLVRRLLWLYRQESIADWRPARAYQYAFRIAAQHGHRYRAVIFAQRSADIFAVVEGEDSPETIKMRGWVTKARRMLKQDESAGPRYGERRPPEEEDEELENWLFSNTGGSMSSVDMFS